VTLFGPAFIAGPTVCSVCAEAAYQPTHSANQTSVTEIEEDSCAPKEFIGLKNGGRNNYIVAGILFQSGRRSENDQRWTVRKLKQHDDGY
jgi:hypothetical protein